MASKLVLAPLVAVVAAACTGVIGDGGDDPSPIPESTPTEFHCDESVVPTQAPLRRLSRVQYENTLHDLVALLLPGQVDAVLDEASGASDQLVDDEREGEDKFYARLARLDQTVQQRHVDSLYAMGLAVAKSLTATDARLFEVVGECAADGDASNDDACLTDFVRRFGERALRRPLSDDDVDFYVQPAGLPPFDAADYGDVIGLVLNAPHLFYLVEHGGAAEGDTEEATDLDAFELASRLSYHFWQTMPDDALFEAARDGSILTEEGYLAQVERIYGDPRTEGALAEFFGQWLENTTLEELDSRIGTPAFDTLRGDFTPSADLREAMLREVVDSALYYATEGGTFRQFFASDRSFARSSELATLYGVAPHTGGEPPEFSDRAGLITRAAYVATGSANTRPIMKGVFLRKAVLCDELGEPPAGAGVEPELSDEMSTREFVAALTSPSECAGCHQYQINGLGFSTEGFDALGRAREVQLLIDPLTGEVTGSAAVDTESMPRVETDDETISAGPDELTELILASDKPYACFSRLYFRFTFGRYEDFDRDACALAAVKDQLVDDASLSEVLRAVALTKQFKLRSFAE